MTPTSRASPGAGDGETIARNTAFALATQIVTATFTAGLTLYLVRALDPDGYGAFALALAVGMLLLLPSDFGLAQSMARFVAERRENPSAVAAIVADALQMKLFTATVISLALFALAAPIADAYSEPALVWPLRGIAVAVFAQGLMAFLVTPFVALQRLSLSFRVVLSESAVETGATLTLVLLGAGATGAAFGRAIGYAFGALVAAALLARVLGRNALRPAGRAHGYVRRIARYAGALLIIDGAWTAFGQVDALVIGGLLGATQVGLFQAPYRLTTMLAYPGLALASAVAPRVSSGGAGPDVRSLQRALRLLLLVQAAFIPPMVVWATPLSSLLLGAGYEDSADVLRALAPYVFAAGFAPLLSLSVNYLGEARRRVPIAVIAVLINLVIDLALIPRLGIVGGAIGTDVAILFYTGAHLLICRRLIALHLRSLLGTALRATAAAGAMAITLLAFGTSELSATALVIGSAAGIAAFALVLAATGELSRDRLAFAGARLAAGFGR